MNIKFNKDILMLTLLSLLCTTTLYADQIPNPATDQKKAIDKMHHKLHDDQAAFKEKEKQALKELNEMTVREDITMEEVNSKVDELMAAKTEIMRLRYGHLVEMRAILTDEQKVGYDKGVLKRSVVK
jgi:Spy/CpxP family protein refolding chaperone